VPWDHDRSIPRADRVVEEPAPGGAHGWQRLTTVSHFGLPHAGCGAGGAANHPQAKPNHERTGPELHVRHRFHAGAHEAPVVAQSVAFRVGV